MLNALLGSKRDTSHYAALGDCRTLLWGAFWFGLFINLLMLAVPIYSLQVLDRVLSSGSHETLLMLTIVVAGCILFMGLLQGLRTQVFNHIGRWLIEYLSSDIVTRTVSNSLKEPMVGNQSLRDLGTIRNFIVSPAFSTLFDAPWAIIFFIVIYLVHPMLGLGVTGGAVILLILAFIAERGVSKNSALANEANIRSFRAMDQILRNAEIVKAMNLLYHAKVGWCEHHDKSTAFSYLSASFATIIGQVTKTARFSIQIFLTALGAIFVLQGEVTVGAMIATYMLTARALAPFDAAVSIYQGLIKVRKAVSRLNELEEATSDLGETMVLPEPKGALNLKQLHYQDPHSDRWLIHSIDFKLASGEALGIIGPSGSGKTTLARLIVGALPATKGAVMLDGAALVQWDPSQLGNAIGYLPQAVELFDGTIAENVARLDKRAPDDSVIQAAQTAMAHETIVSLPKGYRTEIGPSGSRLSAGQRQRIALARCFFGSPKLIVLDEPNANLDAQGELAFLQALKRAKELKITTITIAHSPSVLQNVDKLLVLESGKTKLFGPTRDVMAALAKNQNNIRPIHQAGCGDPTAKQGYST